MKSLIVFTLCSLNLVAAAQFFEANNYDWEAPSYQEREADDSLDLFFIKDKFLFNYHFVDENFVQDELRHRVVYLNSPDGIEEFNRVYIPHGENTELLGFKARSIKGNKVIEVDEDDIQTGIYEETDQEYTYFAIDGLEEGTVVEYFYITREPASYSGTTITYQKSVPVERFELDVIGPDHLVFAAKVYNLADSVQTDTSLTGENRIYVYADDVPAFEEEEMTMADALYGKIIFKLDKNLYSGKRNVTSYAATAQNVVNFINGEVSRKGEKAVKKLLKKIEKSAPEGLSTAQKIDHHLKNEFNFIKNAMISNELDEIIEYQALSNSSALRLYTQLLKTAGIDFQVVYTSNRANMKFDPEFQANSFLNDLLLYIPDEEMFIDYSDAVARNGVINFMLTGTKGVFISETMLNDKVYAMVEINDIPYQDATYSVDTLNVEIEFSEDLSDNKLHVKRITSGYVARNYQPVFDLITDEEDRRKYTETLITYVDEDAEVENLEFRNNSGHLLGRKPLYASGTLTGSEFVQRAGNEYLLNVGKLIGPQTELYNEDTVRHFDIENPFSRLYMRTISFTLPEGYVIANPDKVKIFKTLKINGEEMARFESKISQMGRSYTITVYEFYEGLIYNKDHYPAYSEVINAAADFNKLSLLIKKA